jgi:hypothetical protein
LERSTPGIIEEYSTRAQNRNLERSTPARIEEYSTRARNRNLERSTPGPFSIKLDGSTRARNRNLERSTPGPFSIKLDGSTNGQFLDVIWKMNLEEKIEGPLIEKIEPQNWLKSIF